MSGWMFRAAVGALVVVAGSDLARGGIALAAPVAAPAVAAGSLTDGDLGALPGTAGVDPLAAPVATQAAPAVVPLPPGVVVGLVGLASAAIARRRYLKRH